MGEQVRYREYSERERENSEGNAPNCCIAPYHKNNWQPPSVRRHPLHPIYPLHRYISNVIAANRPCPWMLQGQMQCTYPHIQTITRHLKYMNYLRNLHADTHSRTYKTQPRNLSFLYMWYRVIHMRMHDYMQNDKSSCAETAKNCGVFVVCVLFLVTHAKLNLSLAPLILGQQHQQQICCAMCAKFGTSFCGQNNTRRRTPILSNFPPFPLSSLVRFLCNHQSPEVRFILYGLRIHVGWRTFSKHMIPSRSPQVIL